MFETALIIGGSRGLGRALALHLKTHVEEIKKLSVVARKPVSDSAVHFMPFDMSHESQQDELARLIATEKYDLVIYSAGGGPHGPFTTKDWKDHGWSLNVNLIAPMKMALAWLKARDTTLPGRFIIVGSRIAEQSPDPLAVRYAAGKHGLYGFVSSLQGELQENLNKVWLFSPGYMDTDLLPKSAKVRHDGSKLMNADTAAQACLRWLKKDGPWHRVLN